MTFIDLCKEMMETSRERLKTPLIGAYIFCFLTYNWKPIFELAFSNLAIEDRITIVEVEYGSIERLWHPILIALVYIIIVPAVSVLLEIIMKAINNQKVTNQYASKLHKIQQMTKIAGDELKLKNAQTGNKNAQEYLDEIKELQNSKDQLKEENKLKLNELDESNIQQQNLRKVVEERNIELTQLYANTVDANNNAISKLNKEISDLRRNYSDLISIKNVPRQTNSGELKNTQEVYLDYIASAATSLNKEEKMALFKILIGDVNISNLSNTVIDSLAIRGFLEKKNNVITLTDLGSYTAQYIEKNNL